MTAIVIATIPTALVFFLMQKHFVAGMLGSVKG
jgi:lactose/L-arabinose transport system permease protein